MTPVKVTITNEAAYLTKYTDAQHQALSDYWSFFAPGAAFNPGYKLYVRTKGRRGWDGKARLLNADGSIPAGVYRATQKAIRDELGIRFDVTKDLPSVQYSEPPMAEGPYDYQPECVYAMCKSIKRGGGVVLNATGTGKTKITADFFGRVKYHCLFVVHRVTLLYQTQKELEKWLGEKVGVIGNSEFSTCRVTVATKQTLERHAKKLKAWFNQIAIVVVDELHKQMSKKYMTLLRRIQPIARYGLTATLEMKKKPVRMQAWAFAGPVIYEFPYAEARKRKILTEGSAVQLLFPNESEETEYKYEYKEEIVENKAKLEACSAVVRHLIKAGRFVAVLVHRRAHVKAIRRLFRDIPHRLAYGKVSQVKRKQAITAFEAGKIQLLIASSIFEEGINIKRLDAIIDMAEFKSKNTAIQKFGRGVRLHFEKQNLVYVDIGTQEGRFRKAARSRARALRSLQIKVKVVNVSSGKQAVQAVNRCLQPGKGR